MTLQPAPPGFRLEPLSGQSRNGFTCGESSLDEYLKRQASQDVRRRVAAVYVLVDENDECVVGYYTLSATSLIPASLPERSRKHLPRYDEWPATLLGRLAVDDRLKGCGLGRWLLGDALVRSLSHSAQVASLAVLVDPLNERAEGFYQDLGFRRLESGGRRMFMMMNSIEAMFVE